MKKVARSLSFIASLVAIMLILTACSVNPRRYNPNEKAGPQVNYTVTGIDAGAEEMVYAQNSLKAYGLQQNKWELQTSSSAAMLSVLKKAIHYHQAIVITGWEPHWMFQKYPVKFLKDPKHQFAKPEDIDTLIHKGFDKQNPGAYHLLKNFHWNADLMDEIMFKIDNGADPAKTAKWFLNKHPQLVKQWLSGVPRGHGQVVKLALVSWDSELASSNVVAQLLKMKGYTPQLNTMELQPMWISLSSGSTDASTAGWLPITMGNLYKKYQNNVQIVRSNLYPAKIGMVVPKYMKKINSIADLRNK